ncbi:hypothetical protein F4782DRAFT_529550 [Xylaria castorea]|nr:hypothetical protein F4782DRAFT_529550 [Xylaria castorea]
MSNTEQGQSQETAKRDFDMIERYFDLERASLPCEPESEAHHSTQNSGKDIVVDADNPGFTPITGRQEDPYVKQLEEALKHENDLGGRGPFHFPHSPDTFMGSADRAIEQPLKTAEAIPREPLIDDSIQIPFDTIAHANPNMGYDLQRAAWAGAMVQAPVVQNYNLSWAYGFQNQNYSHAQYHWKNYNQ